MQPFNRPKRDLREIMIEYHIDVPTRDGANLITKRDDSPHLGADNIKAEVYFACADIDHYAPKEVIGALQAHLQTTHLNYRLEWYPGAEHGFAFPSRSDIYDKPSAERHWVRLFDLFKRNLGPT
jgi:carboxymethylenebutenolidase